MPTRRDDAPLIVTALLSADSFSAFDRLRRQHFPPSRNQVPAHISLFHQLPGDALDAVLRDIDAACGTQTSFDMAPAGVRFLGRGVALGYAAQELHLIRERLARAWSPWLTAQDRQPFRPHVTIQNKVAAAAARALFETIRTAASPACRIEGLAVWRYLDGPWDPVAERRFRAEDRPGSAQ